MNTSLTWTELLDLILPERPIAKRKKSEGRVEYWREWDPIFESAVWTKIYHGQQELAAFNQWEFDFLTQLSEHKVPQTYRAVDMRRKGTQLNLGPQYEIKTLHAGPTLDDWLYTPVQPGQSQVNTQIQAHCLVQPEHFVRMACSLLRALEAIHNSNYIHCDLHPGNISIPIRRLGDQKNSTNPTFIQFEIEWDKLTLIDFGFSINKHNAPKTTLPFKKNCYGARISPHLTRVLDDIEVKTTRQLKAGETWLQVWLDSGFWQRWQGPSPLETIKQVDWREDMYQLGMLLADIRDGKGQAKHLEGGTVRMSTSQDINSIIATLPEQLIEWGQGAGTPTPPMPHRQYIDALDAALSAVRGQSASAVFTVRQSTVLLVPTSQQSQFFSKRQAFKEFQDVVEPWCPVVVAIPAALEDLAICQSGLSPPLASLAVSKDPITIGQFRAFMAHSRRNERRWEMTATKLKKPVTNVSRVDVEEWLTWLNAQLHSSGLRIPPYRLLFVNEWHYCCSCGEMVEYFIGNNRCTDISRGDAVYKLSEKNRAGDRWPDRENLVEAQNVDHGWNKTNRFNLRGMHGNVWELVALKDGFSTTIKGGSYSAAPFELAASYQSMVISMSHHSPGIGFRICRDLSPTELESKGDHS